MLTDEAILHRPNTGSNPGTIAYDFDLARFVASEVRKEYEAEIASLNRRLNECLMCAASEAEFADAARERAEKDEALIRQMLEALEQSNATLWEEDDDPARPAKAAITAARARLGEKEGT